MVSIANRKKAIKLRHFNDVFRDFCHWQRCSWKKIPFSFALCVRAIYKCFIDTDLAMVTFWWRMLWCWKWLMVGVKTVNQHPIENKLNFPLLRLFFFNNLSQTRQTNSTFTFSLARCMHILIKYAKHEHNTLWFSFWMERVQSIRSTKIKKSPQMSVICIYSPKTIYFSLIIRQNDSGCANRLFSDKFISSLLFPSHYIPFFALHSCFLFFFRIGIFF